MLAKIDLSIQENRQELYNFYHRHYEAPAHLLPESPEALTGTYYAFTDGVHTLAVTKHTYVTPHLLRSNHTVVHKDFRNQGVGKRMGEAVHDMCREMGVTKITCNVYVDNIPSIVLKLKQGFLVEGLVRNHEETGRHEYIMGKEL
jgi:RimJ/RimL family protein N-acetyltransferase